MAYINPSKSDEWRTPKVLYDYLNEKYDFNFDPCPVNAGFDGLKIDWKERNFVNPPYSNLSAWTKKCMEESKKGKLVVLLMPARTDTNYFHDYVLPYASIEFIRGRLRFGKGDKQAPFASIICVYKKSFK